MSLSLVRAAAGLALLAALTAGCSTAVAAHSSAPKPTATAHSAKPSVPPSAKPSVSPTAKPSVPPTTQPPAPPTTQPPPPPATMPASPPNPISQGDGGDHDSDNNGGPSVGDGNI